MRSGEKQGGMDADDDMREGRLWYLGTRMFRRAIEWGREGRKERDEKGVGFLMPVCRRGGNKYRLVGG